MATSRDSRPGPGSQKPLGTNPAPQNPLGDTSGSQNPSGDTAGPPKIFGDTSGSQNHPGHTSVPPKSSGDTRLPPNPPGDTSGSQNPSGDTRVPKNRPGVTRVPKNPSGDTSGTPKPLRAPRAPQIPPQGRARPRIRGSAGGSRPSLPSSPIVQLQDASSAPPPRREKPETIRIITRDMIRELIVPRERPPGSLVIGSEDFQRIQDEARAPRRELADRLRILRARQDAAFVGISRP
ncbi:basic salivary proline-rich protein 1-like [Oenanthe melanoleuca]|uniref:basic salivary proline-rich protein 1-like n=1 Tax=Oenanthe melanoleuca TaxID=2939378 RepID=UPI0024C11E26|nr:basic salivary proline-rich protein 1-like [Oenanthe melanoleuca]